MTETPGDDLKRLEQRKREANCNPAARWRVLQETITWAESQATVGRNTPQKCLVLQRAKLSGHQG
ncbi:MAG: hypothetical protein ACYTG0_40520 [Planctomycetota bacterium]|jgi:hypothetical protein